MELVLVGTGQDGSDHAYETVLSLRIAFNVPLGRLDGPVAHKLLNIAQ